MKTKLVTVNVTATYMRLHALYLGTAAIGRACDNRVRLTAKDVPDLVVDCRIDNYRFLRPLRKVFERLALQTGHELVLEIRSPEEIVINEVRRINSGGSQRLDLRSDFAQAAPKNSGREHQENVPPGRYLVSVRRAWIQRAGGATRVVMDLDILSGPVVELPMVEWVQLVPQVPRTRFLFLALGVEADDLDRWVEAIRGKRMVVSRQWKTRRDGTAVLRTFYLPSALWDGSTGVAA